MVPRCNIKDLLPDRKIAGIDVSGWFHAILSHEDVVREFHTSPKIPVKSFMARFDEKLSSVLSFGVDPFVVFDGEFHPMKHKVDEHRKAPIVEALMRLQKLYKKGEESDYGEVEKERKKAMTMRNDLIAMIVDRLREHGIRFIQAPFEAEWQLCYLLKKNYIDAILSEDGDFFGLGAKGWITKFNYNSGQCQFFDSEEMMITLDLVRDVRSRLSYSCCYTLNFS